MFFYAAKLIWFVAQPSAALVLMLAGGVLAVGFGAVRTGFTLTILAMIGLFVGGFLPLGAALLLPLEQRFARVEPNGAPTGIVVLGGAVDESVGEARGVVALTDASERMTEAVALALRYPTARIVFTGGSASIIPHGVTEGQQARRFFKAMGIADSRVTIEEKSRDTAENARLTKALVDPKPGEQWMLVTSGWHMPRSVGCFRVAGWPVLPWPTDYRTGGPGTLIGLMPRPSYGLNLVDIAAREWIGLVAYRLAGRTDALFPAP